MRILITGEQGSGKTTQAKILAEKLGLTFVSAGHLAREFAQGDSPEAHTVAADLEKGSLINNEIMSGLVRERLSHPDCQNGFVLDGYPRSMDQLSLYDPNFDLVIYLKISDQVAIQRLLSRGRSDDTLEAIKNRLEWSHQETEKVMQTFRSAGKLVEINGEKSIEENALEVEKAVQEWKDAKGQS